MDLQVGVKVLIKNNQDEFLFLLRSEQVSTDVNEPAWDIPGGRINKDEALLDALSREVEEETGFNIQSTPKLIAAQDIFVPAKDLHVVRLTYMAEENPLDIRLSKEHSSYRWVGRNAILSLNTEPYLREILTNFL